MKLWKAPTRTEIAAAAGVSKATVDRVLNQRLGVREGTRLRVEAAIRALNTDPGPSVPGLRKISFILEAGSGFISLIEKEAKRATANYPDMRFTFDSMANVQVNDERFYQLIRQRARESEAIVLVSRDEPRVNRAVREAVNAGITVICLTTDLPNSNRTAYVGVDQVSTGASAAWLMGRFLSGQPGNILLLYSSTYRTQEEREIGFRRVMRTEFSHLNIIDRFNMNDESDGAYACVKKYISENKPFSGVYNMAGGNDGVVKALREHGLADKVVFIGHELSDSTLSFLDKGEMDAVLGHDVKREIEMCLSLINERYEGKMVMNVKTPLIIYNKFSFL